MNRRLVVAAAVLALLAVLGRSAALNAQMSDQSFEVTSAPDSVTVGDTVTLHLRLRLSERDLLFDTLPQPVGARDPAIQIFSIGRLERDKDRVWNGEARVAYYRPGRQALPQFGVAFARVVAAVERAVLSSQNGLITVSPTLPPGDQPLKDIRPLQHTPSPILPWVLIPLLLLALIVAVGRFRRRIPRVAIIPPTVVIARPDPVATALDRLRQIEAEPWLTEGQAARHYEAVANVVRDYLAEIEGTPARELTSRELVQELRRREAPVEAVSRCRMVLVEADAVKFAAVTPGAPESSSYLTSARILISEWRADRTGGAHAAG